MQEHPIMTNEELCALAQDGQRWAREQLVANNLSFVYQVATSLWERYPNGIQTLVMEDEKLC